MSAVTIKWEDLDLECKVKYQPAEPDVGIMQDEYHLEEAYLPNGSDFTCRLNEATIREIEEKATEAIKAGAGEAKAERMHFDKAEGWA